MLTESVQDNPLTTTEAGQQSGPDPQERRRQLRRMDDLLDILEKLNLAQASRVPSMVADQLQAIGVDPDGGSISALIEMVWAAQEPYMIPMRIERRQRGRRTKQDMQLQLAVQTILNRLKSAS